MEPDWQSVAKVCRGVSLPIPQSHTLSHTLPSSVTTASRQPPPGENPDGDHATDRTVARVRSTCAVAVTACSRRHARWKDKLLTWLPGFASTCRGDACAVHIAVSPADQLMSDQAKLRQQA